MCSKIDISTRLLCENSLYADENDDLINSSREVEELQKDILLTKINIKGRKLESLWKEKQGVYYTIEKKNNSPFLETEMNLISQEIEKILNLYLFDSKKVFVVGLGNEKISCDNFSKQIVDRLKPFEELKCMKIDVEKRTGFNTMELIQGIVKSQKVDALILIDSATSLDFSKIGKAFQISTTEIVPASGVKKSNLKRRISTDVKVISIVVPTLINLKNLFDDFLPNTNCNDIFNLKKIKLENYFVSTADIEIQNFICAKIISEAINNFANNK